MPNFLVLQIAEDYKLTAEQAEKFGCSRELDTLTRKMCKKFTSLNITREEYLLLKSIILFNIGELLLLSLFLIP